MGRTTTIQCDMPGCDSSVERKDRADNLAGWILRTVNDVGKKVLAEGVRDLSGHTSQYLCPKHVRDGARLPTPSHPEVIEFLEQVENFDGSSDLVSPSVGRPTSEKVEKVAK